MRIYPVQPGSHYQFIAMPANKNIVFDVVGTLVSPTTVSTKPSTPAWAANCANMASTLTS